MPFHPSSHFRRLIPSSWSPECWSVAYFFNRLKSTLYWITHPQLPWFTAEANRFLIQYLRPEFRLLEFGSGRSTRFFAKHCAFVCTVEHDPVWIAKLQAASLPNLEIRAASPEEVSLQAASFPDHYFDVILIDGIHRMECLLASLPKLNTPGILILDNANRYFPNQSKGPGSLRTFNLHRPDHHLAQQAQQTLAGFQQIWTTNGVTDTLIAMNTNNNLLVFPS